MLRFLKQIEKFASILMLGIMCFCITLQVFFRYVLSNALEWPEEVSRYAFLCAVFLGASFAAALPLHPRSICGPQSVINSIIGNFFISAYPAAARSFLASSIFLL